MGYRNIQQRQLIAERGKRLAQPDHDPATAIVCVDPADRPFLVLSKRPAPTM
jgi:hypothetical protein